MDSTIYSDIKPLNIVSAEEDASRILTEETIESLCKKYHVRYHIAEGVLFVSTETGNWRILHTEDFITGVYHQNLELSRNRRKKGSFEYGYHKQKIYYTELEDVLKYICVHDKNSRYTHKKMKIENLFQQISTC